MFRSQRANPTTLADTLGALPAGMKVFVLDEAWLVVGRCGLFVVTEDEGDLAAASLRAASLADAVRLQLSDELVWVPFIDAMCATHEVQFDPDQLSMRKHIRRAARAHDKIADKDVTVASIHWSRSARFAFVGASPLPAQMR